MRWLDVAGAPGVGKTTLCDGLWPRKIADDGAPLPSAWFRFASCARRLIAGIEPEDSSQSCREILERYLRKAATLYRRTGDGVYINAGLAQAGLEIGWRSAEGVVDYFTLMPVSAGVAFLWADPATLVARNRARLRDRSHMVEGMERARVAAMAALTSRGAPCAALDTREPVAVNVARLRALAGA